MAMSSPAGAEQASSPARRLCSVPSSVPQVELTTVDDGPTSSAVLGPNFVFVPEGNAEIACGPDLAAHEELTHTIVTASAQLDLNVDIAVVLTTHRIGCDDLFYVAVQNHVEGIGYQRTEGTGSFDHDSRSSLEGIAFLNDFPYWQTRPDEFRTAFLHEVGHRWAARVHAERQGKHYDLTGREGAHWSYFLDSGGSPLEGNAFDPEQPFSTQTPQYPSRYSDLDLYLMGALPPAEVAPIRLLTDVSDAGSDCIGNQVSESSPPQRCASKTLDGTWVNLSVDDVVQSEGKREPSVTATRKTKRVAFFVLGVPGKRWSAESCRRLRDAAQERIDDFARATRGLFSLHDTVTDLSQGGEGAGGGGGVGGGAAVSSMGCSQLAELTQGQTEAGGGCSLRPAKARWARQGVGRWFWIVALVLLHVRSRRRRFGSSRHDRLS